MVGVEGKEGREGEGGGVRQKSNITGGLLIQYEVEDIYAFCVSPSERFIS